MMRHKALFVAFPYTIPVLMGYLFLGIAFGVLLSSHGYHVGWAFLMSLVIYAGAMQFVAIGLLTGPFGLFNAFIMTLSVNARHLFYGLSMLDKFKVVGRFRPYMIFSLTDETYSLLCVVEPPEGVSRKGFMFSIAALNHSYWMTGSVIGALAGTLIPFDATGIDFAMTALFIVIFVEQWESTKEHSPALLGIGISIIGLLLFGAYHFIIFSMIGILCSMLLLYKKSLRRKKS